MSLDLNSDPGPGSSQAPAVLCGQSYPGVSADTSSSLGWGGGAGAGGGVLSRGRPTW